MTIGEAMDWVRNRGREFGEARDRIVQGRERAAVVARSLPRGSTQRATAGKVVGRWSELLADHTRTFNRWNAVAARIPGLEGLGVVPVVPLALAGTVIAVAVSMAFILRRVTAEERALRLLERGRITPAQAVELAANIEGARPGLFGAIGAGNMIPLALAGAAAFFFFGRGR